MGIMKGFGGYRYPGLIQIKLGLTDTDGWSRSRPKISGPPEFGYHADPRQFARALGRFSENRLQNNPALKDMLPLRWIKPKKPVHFSDTLIPFAQRRRLPMDTIDEEDGGSEDRIPGLFLSLQDGNADAVNVCGERLRQVPEKDRVQLLAAITAEDVSGLSDALREGRLEAVEQYIKVVNEMALDLDRDVRAALLENIRKSYAVHSLGEWVNRDFYKRLEKEHPEFHVRFNEMKDILAGF